TALADEVGLLQVVAQGHEPALELVDRLRALRPHVGRTRDGCEPHLELLPRLTLLADARGQRALLALEVLEPGARLRERLPRRAAFRRRSLRCLLGLHAAPLLALGLRSRDHADDLRLGGVSLGGSARLLELGRGGGEGRSHRDELLGRRIGGLRRWRLELRLAVDEVARAAEL